MVRIALFGLSLGVAPACLAFDTIDPGDDPPIRTASLDRGFFACRIQPEVISASGCATGRSGESCHQTESSYRLHHVEPTYASECDGNVHPAPPAEVEENFVTTEPWVFEDVENSPLLARPTGEASHPRTIFGDTSPEADLIREWVSVRR